MCRFATVVSLGVPPKPPGSTRKQYLVGKGWGQVENCYVAASLRLRGRRQANVTVMGRL